jgi:hypothetical protein
MPNIYTFIKQIGIFFAVAIIPILLLFFYLDYKNNELINNYKIPNTTRTIFVGDSHVQQCVNDSIVPNALNIAQSAEPYYFTYFKLDRLLVSNTSIKKIYLGYSYHNLSDYYDDFVFGTYSKDIIPRYFYILPNNQKLNVIRNNANNIGTLLINILRNGVSSSFFGSYQSEFTKTAASKTAMDKRLKLQFYKSDTLSSFSAFNLLYLDKIVNLCKEKNIELILLNTPLNDYYKSKIPAQYIAEYNRISKKYNFKIINFESLIFEDDCFIPDGDHVSLKGAIIASQYISKQ